MITRIYFKAKKKQLFLITVKYSGDRSNKQKKTSTVYIPTPGANIFTTQIMNALARVSKIKTNPSAPARVVSTSATCAANACE